VWKILLNWWIGVDKKFFGAVLGKIINKQLTFFHRLINRYKLTV